MIEGLNAWFVTLLLYLDDWRIQLHLQRAEWRLRRQGCSGLSPNLQAARVRRLDQLNIYWRRRRFPRNKNRGVPYMPCFIDAQGRTCAVAHLMIAAGQSQLAERVAQEANYAYLAEMHFPELE